jgi:hypothetical protein
LRQDCLCPITHELLQDPVTAADGHSYERQAITRWFAERGTSPMTNAPLASRALLPNLLVARVVRGLRGAAHSESEDGGPSESSANPQEEPPIAAGALLEAAQRGDRELCLSILARGVPDINAKLQRAWYVFPGLCCVGEGGTVLHVAAAHGWEDVCRLILATQDFQERHARDLDCGEPADTALQIAEGLLGELPTRGLASQRTGLRTTIQVLNGRNHN